MLSASFSTRLGAFALDLALEASPEEIVAVVGPNGAGKSTLLKTLAGLNPIDQGHITVDGTTWESPADGIRIPAEHRRVGYVPQSGLLFPHLTAAQNVAFGIGDDLATARMALGRLGLADQSEVMPRLLSGGQVQLVALARALVRAPTLLLLDEPMASVDVSQRVTVRRLIRRELRDRSGYRLIVTHDPLEAAALADRLIVVYEGRVSQVGTIDDLRTRPATAYVAELIGMNFYRGEAQAGIVQLESGTELISATDLTGPVIATIHPRAVSLYSERPSGSPRNVWRGEVAAIEPSLDQVRVHVTGPIDLIAQVTPAGASQFAEGQAVWASVKASEVVTNLA